MDNSCPLITIRGKKKPYWWSKELEEPRKDCRKSFNRAKLTKDPSDWDRYKVSLRYYKKLLRKSKRSSWRNFCGKIEDSSEAARLRKILSTNPTMLSSLKNSTGGWTSSHEETLNLLLDTHFPGSSTTISDANHDLRHSSKTNIKLISKERLTWAINSFKPYKSPGPDGIIPAELQNVLDIIWYRLVIIMESCIRFSYVPRAWREAKVVFIPKAGKCSHATPKDLRPISLSSFLLKTLERMIDIHIRQEIKPCLLSRAQHAYTKGKSVETALHSLVSFIEQSLHHKEYTLVTFLDIEGAFNNIRSSAILGALNNLGVDDQLKNLIGNMLNSRIICSELGNFKTRRATNRGTPQGGVLSPLLWNLAVNKLLLDLEDEGFKVTAYADDVAIAVTGKYPQTLAELLQTALNKLTIWAEDCGLNVNPHKTELVLFTRRYKIPNINPPAIKGVSITLSDHAKFLGLFLDKKLTWKLNIEERAKKAYAALFSCKKAIGGKWGFSPKIAHWLYTSVIRPILTYGVLVWWTALDKETNLKKLNKVQRVASMCISGALRSTPSDALDIILDLTPLGIFSTQIAASSAIRLKATHHWNNNHVGHTSILKKTGFNPDHLDYTTPQMRFDNNFQISIPSRTEWEDRSILDNESLHFYTDGSKTKDGVGSGIFSEKLNLSLFFRLPNHCSVFQAEILAIKEVLTWLKENVISSTDIRIFSDSQAAIKSLASVSTNSITVLNCQSSLREMSEQFNIHLTWVPGHRDILGNCKADELAKQGTTTPLRPERNNIGIPIATCKLMLKQKALEKMHLRWTQGITCIKTKQIWPSRNLKRTKELLSLKRLFISSTIGVLTGHCLIGRHAIRMGVFSHDYCRSCMDEEEEETVQHLLCTCPALSNRRKLHLGEYFYSDTSDLVNLDIKSLSLFIRSSEWFG